MSEKSMEIRLREKIAEIVGESEHGSGARMMGDPVTCSICLARADRILALLAPQEAREPSGAEAVVREVSRLEGVVAACIPTVIDGHNRLKVARSIIDNLRYCGLLPTAPGAPEEGTERSVKVLEALYDTANDALVTRDVWVERAMRALRLGVYAEATENGAL